VNSLIQKTKGLRLFLLRGLEKVDAERHLIAAKHNLLKLFRDWRSVWGSPETADTWVGHAT
jgi:hypothetical protein